MKVGLTIGVRRLPQDKRPMQELYRDCLETAVLAEELGWDQLWMPEHHVSDLWASSPLALLTGIAARTSRIRLGTYVVLLGLHHPIRVAEDIATVDLVSNGRFDFAVGGGGQQAECDLFSIPKEETFGRTYEALSIIEQCFTKDQFSHHGKYFHFDDVRFSPKSVQKPYPPIWVAAMGPQSAKRAARRGYGLAAGLGPSHEVYVESWKEAGRHPQDMSISSVPIYGHIADSKEAAWDDYEEAQYHKLQFYSERGRGNRVPPVGELRHVNDQIDTQALLIGTVDEVARGLEAYRGKGLTHLSFGLSTYVPDPVKKRRSMELFAKTLLPEMKLW
jgi:alkanesulfonate monooxygenase SsuD/methylene tetrahydromethanopterin reductase-like flavin-dependent oxidoreductase (luciferase family)